MHLTSFYIFLLNILCLLLPAWASSFNCSQPPNFQNNDINACCRMPKIDLGNIPQKCDEYISALKSSKGMYPAYMHLCYPECIYREAGSLSNGEIKIENVKNFLEIHVNQHDKAIIPHIVRSFETCLANIKLHLKVSGVKSFAKLTPEGCSPFASMVYGCVNTETFLHCPAQMWKNEQYCNLAKSFAEQCYPLPHITLPIL